MPDGKTPEEISQEIQAAQAIAAAEQAVWEAEQRLNDDDDE